MFHTTAHSDGHFTAISLSIPLIVRTAECSFYVFTIGLLLHNRCTRMLLQAAQAAICTDYWIALKHCTLYILHLCQYTPLLTTPWGVLPLQMSSFPVPTICRDDSTADWFSSLDGALG
jgi:hypothetical protein